MNKTGEIALAVIRERGTNMPQTETRRMHTPGPWDSKPTAGHSIHGQSAVYAETDGNDIAIVYDGDANSNLIAAAPEMLDALEAIYKWLGNVTCKGPDAPIEAVEAAIRKAKGER